MKKKLALLMAAIMTLSLVPMTAFAASDNRVTKVVTGSKDTVIDAADAPVLVLEKKDLLNANQSADPTDPTDGDVIEFELDLTNAEWKLPFSGTSPDDYEYLEVGGPGATIVGFSNVYAQLLTAKSAIIRAVPTGTDAQIRVPMAAELTDNGEATVTVDPLTSVVSGGTYTFANVASGSTVTTIEDKEKITESTGAIKPIVITETAAGSFDEGRQTIKLRLGGDFKWNMAASDVTVTMVPTSAGITVDRVYFDPQNDDELYIDITVPNGGTKEATRLAINGIDIVIDDADIGDIAEITISGAGISRETIEVGVATDYGYTLTVEDKELPILYSGRINDEEDTLKVTFEETIENSWWSTRKTTFTFPEGVKPVDVTIDDVNGTLNNAALIDTAVDTGMVRIDGNAVVLQNIPQAGAGDKAEFDMEVMVSIDPSFEGDITMTAGGAGVGDEQTVTVAKAVMPVKVTAEKNPVSIDYRNVAVSDITVTESYAGAVESGESITLKVDNMRFDTTPTVEVVEGDMKIDDVRKNNDAGTITIEVDTASSKTPATLKLSGIQLYLDRSLPAGNYPLSLAIGDDSYIETSGIPASNYDAAYTQYRAQNNANDEGIFMNVVERSSQAQERPFFTTDDIVMVEDYVEVVTAGRDQDDSTFTTQIVVTIGSTTMMAGDKEIALDVPAYISNGYTMLPVRAVTEALSNVAIVRWDDPTKTVTITFGSRVISMTVGSNMMTINGVQVAMSAACEITDERAFIPLRDLGYALGLNDTKIQWDDATKTATLN